MVIFGQISGAIALIVLFAAFIQAIAKKSERPASAGTRLAEAIFICLIIAILAAACINIASVIVVLVH